LPQFNWMVLGPIVLILGLAIGGSVFLVSHFPHASAQPSNTTALSATRTPTPSGIQLSGRVIGTPHVRAQPNSTSGVIQDLQGGQAVQISACSDRCAYYLVGFPGQPAQGWVSSAFVDLQGDESKLPVAH
jgi:hypothetical protein